VEWQSLTFIGERHEAILRTCGPGAEEAARRIVTGLEDAEFSIAGHVLADIALLEEPQVQADGAVVLHIEALTIAE
jgi:hypothetical protein